MHNVYGQQAKWQTVGRANGTDAQATGHERITKQRTSNDRRLRICICILQTIEKVVKVFHAGAAFTLSHTHTHIHWHSRTHSRRHLKVCNMVFCSDCAYAMAQLDFVGWGFCLAYYSPQSMPQQEFNKKGPTPSAHSTEKLLLPAHLVKVFSSDLFWLVKGCR